MGCMEAVNIFSSENTEGRVDVARAVGSTATEMFIYDLASGQSSCPYHYEYEEEWLLVVDGTVVVRTPDGEHILERGAGKDVDVLELAGAGSLGVSGQRQDRHLARRRGKRTGLQARHGCAMVGGRGGLGESRLTDSSESAVDSSAIRWQSAGAT